MEFREQYAEYCKNTSEVLNRDCNVDRLLTFNTYAYDSVWTMVLAMNKSLMTLSADAFNNFTFFNDSVGISVELRRQLQLTNFTGISVGSCKLSNSELDEVVCYSCMLLCIIRAQLSSLRIAGIVFCTL